MLWIGISARALGQQFNSDNYWTAPHGISTIVLTRGQHYSTLIDVVALFPGWEFNVGATLFNEDQATGTTDHFSTTLYVKRMFYENPEKNGGWAIMAGTGLNPGFLQAGTITQSFRTYWAYAPVTLPLFGGTLSWDIMPGSTVNLDHGRTDLTAWGFLYSSRLAIYKAIPSSAIVAEVFGTAGEAFSDPQYKIGVRYETPNVIAALTYGAALNGDQGAGVELGVMFLTPPFLCFGGCKEAQAGTP